MGENVSLINGHIDSNNLGVDGLYIVCKELQNTSARTSKEKIISDNKNYDDFRQLLLFLFDNSVTTGLDIKKVNKGIKLDRQYAVVPLNTFSSIVNKSPFLSILLYKFIRCLSNK